MHQYSSNITEDKNSCGKYWNDLKKKITSYPVPELAGMRFAMPVDSLQKNTQGKDIYRKFSNRQTNKQTAK